MFQTL